MFDALIARFNCRSFVTANCKAKDIDADVIIFFDPHSSHHVKIEGIGEHPALKMEYWNDMQQKEISGLYHTLNVKVHKLGAKQRVERVKRRGVSCIISAVKQAFYDHFGEYFGADTEKMLLHFPHAPAKLNGKSIPYNEKQTLVLGNGATHGEAQAYGFRSWAYQQPMTHFVEHTIFNGVTPKGSGYLPFLSTFKAALALCSVFPVPKYYEIPTAGCLTFAEYHTEYEELGFRDFRTCVYVTKDNFESRLKDFHADPEAYKGIAEAGKALMESRYTAEHFADFIYTKAQERIATNG
jgi:hypothetical protein